MAIQGGDLMAWFIFLKFVGHIGLVKDSKFEENPKLQKNRIL